MTTAAETPRVDEPFIEQATAAKEAARALAPMDRMRKDAALLAMADALEEASETIVSANAEDVARARDNGTDPAIIDRLRLDGKRVAGMAQGLRDLAALPDPVGDVERGWVLPNGMSVRQVRVPLGVLGIIYEARPNVTADAAGIALKSGNAVLLRGSSSAESSNRAITAVLRHAIGSFGIPRDVVQLVTGPRSVTDEMMKARGLVDVLIPRGGAGLIQAVVTGAQVPVIETGTGNCHLYVDASADLRMALDVLVNAKTQRCSVCNAVETLLVHRSVAEEFLRKAVPALGRLGVSLHGDETTVEIGGSTVVPAVPADFEEEWLSMDLSVAVVDDLGAALDHIRRYSSGHSETIITNDLSASERFVSEVDAAAVLVNASSRFVDGGEFGFGAEIGISTQKLHARGPMGLAEMTTTKYVVHGQGQTRG
ncbi:glutamate-5-semialdehyde dehydrogenase [Parenemella sanctibonifatiensis]|uniref:Gamma-glutamyl phosphate reductase n=1 Tax=Parenemella sanctibonifatiensis TaxID=2016505 RepID=A0A255E0Z3_9ACTN|nr:glutamate-5-semialdehyde dehydrogenase [Parenemella sanctibonifatiensis]OYN85229.1 glutamate-5-semialdehyde dehydrogenase [Parenemella sanctibonifatiensis]